MGRTSLFFILITVIFLSFGCGEEANIKKGTEKALPRLNLEENDNYKLKMELIQAISSIEDGNEQVIDQSLNIDFIIKVNNVSEEGFYSLVADINEITLTRNIPLKETIEINSKNLKKKDIDTNYAKIVGSLMEKSILLEVDDRGIIRSRKIVKRNNNDSMIANERFLPKIFEEHISSRQNLELFFPYYPQDSVFTKQSWNQESLIPGESETLAKSQLSIDSINSDTLFMTVATTLTQQKTGGTSNKDAQISRSGNQTKSFIINKTSGWPSSVEILSEVKVMEKIGLKIMKTTTTNINFNSEKVK